MERLFTCPSDSAPLARAFAVFCLLNPDLVSRADMARVPVELRAEWERYEARG